MGDEDDEDDKPAKGKKSGFAFKKGDKVQAQFDDEWSDAVIEEVGKKKVTVVWDADDSESEVGLDDIRARPSKKVKEEPSKGKKKTSKK
jgi:hypothetical protein